MTITAKVVADSVARSSGVRITTMEIYYPRMIHSEFMTHRVFARNASSSRAMPVAKLLSSVWHNPAEPSAWGSNKPGMQAGAELTGWRLELTKLAWHGARVGALGAAWLAMKAGAHKQIVNRILEPWSHIRVLVTSTHWSNFWALRDHPDADPTIRELARKMHDAYDISTPKILENGEWHMPYINEQDKSNAVIYDAMHNNGKTVIQEKPETLLRMSAAHCARLSYNLFSGAKPTVEADLKLFDQLAGSAPVHASPLEHQATPDAINQQTGKWMDPDKHGCFTGFKQFRKYVEGEAIMENYT